MRIAVTTGRLACLALLASGIFACRSLPVPAPPTARGTAAIELSLRVASSQRFTHGRGRLWLRLMSIERGEAAESELLWWLREDGSLALQALAAPPALSSRFAWFPKLEPGRYRLASFVVTGQLATASGAPVPVRLAGGFERTRAVSVGPREHVLLGALQLRFGTDRTYVYALSPAASAEGRTQLAAASDAAWLERPAVAANYVRGNANEPASASAPTAGPPREDVAVPGVLPQEPGADGAPAVALLGLTLPWRVPLLESERASGSLRLILRPLGRTELTSVEVGWEQLPGAPASLAAAQASPLGKGILLPIALAPGRYELRQLALEGRIEGPEGRRHIDVRGGVPGAPVFELRPGSVLDLGDLRCAVRASELQITLLPPGGGDGRKRAIEALDLPPELAFSVRPLAANGTRRP